MEIKMTFVEDGVTAEAVFLEEKAPQTSRLLWETLAQPLEEMAIHAMFTGRELSFPIPHERIEAKALDLPPENQIVFPVPGDLVWNAYQPYQWQGVPHPVYDFGIYYGRDCRILLPLGWRPSNHFGLITHNLETFAEVAARCQSEGRKMIRIERK